MRIRSGSLALIVSMAGWSLVGTVSGASAQPLGTFAWQLQPYCNIVRVTVVQQGGQYQLDGTDDQCGAAQKGSVTGLAFLNANGTVGFGLNVVTAPGGVPVHIAATISLSTLSGTWSDSAGAKGPFVFTPGAGIGGNARPIPVVGTGDITAVSAGTGLLGGGSTGDVSLNVDFAMAQARVTGVCSAGTYVAGVNQDGTVACSSSSEVGDISSVIAGPGLTGGAVSGDATLAVAFGGSGASFTAARSDHNHASGTNSVAIGPSAMSLGTGSGNVAMGNSALRANTTGSSNTALGLAAMDGNTTGQFNTAVGSNALPHNTTSSNNTAVGAGALFDSTGTRNTAVGRRALGASTTGNDNTAVGGSALAGNTTGNQSTAVGVESLLSSQTGRNTAVGTSALRAVVTGGFNVAVGAEALGMAQGSSNVSAGDSSLQSLTTGNGNTAVGDFAGALLTTGSNNLYLADPGVSSENNTTRIGSAQTRAFIAGVRGITTGANNAITVMIDANGQLGTASSSRRTKTDIDDLGAGVAFKLQSLRPVQFRYKQPFAGEGQPLQYGLIAEEVEAVMPELVAYNAQGEVETVKYHVLPSLLLAEVQRLERDRHELTRQVAEQAAELAHQAAAISELRAALEELRTRQR
jgi:hypothetical protein